MCICPIATAAVCLFPPSLYVTLLQIPKALKRRVHTFQGRPWALLHILNASQWHLYTFQGHSSGSSTHSKCPNDIIPLALSNIDTSDLKGTPSLALLEAQESWEGFKTLMERMYDTKKVSIWNEVELLKSLVKGDTENARHFLLRVHHVVRIIKESENELS